MELLQQVIHKSVLIAEVIENLNIKPGGLYVDATLGGGGHTRAILREDSTCRVIGCDWDKEELDKQAKLLLEEFPGRFEPLWGNFADLPRLLHKKKISKVSGILADFGTSQMQIGMRAGFSFGRETALDMRMSTAHFKTTAAHIVNQASEKELAEIFWRYGEERFSRRIARVICEERRKKKIETTTELARIVCMVVPLRHGVIHPATRVFQALRIVVNKELDNIHALLMGSIDLIEPGGRLVCISFHSLEDRIVKQFIRDHKAELTAVTRHVVVAGEAELDLNLSARSAKLRAAQRR